MVQTEGQGMETDRDDRAGSETVTDRSILDDVILNDLTYHSTRLKRLERDLNWAFLYIILQGFSILILIWKGWG